jgi:CubicO group peptidase (beta-lactamase class C family)
MNVKRMRRVGLRAALTAALVIPAAAAASTAQAAAPDPAQLERTLTDFLRKHPAFTGALVAVRTPRLTWTGAAGVAKRGSRIPLDPHAPFRIASVTKTFTSAAILRLIEDRRLGLDDSIARTSAGPPSPSSVKAATTCLRFAFDTSSSTRAASTTTPRTRRSRRSW